MSVDSRAELALIVGAARSGTTLLRLLLDAHPEIGCPAEAGLPALMSHMASVWATIDADIRGDADATDPGEPVVGTPGGPDIGREVAPTPDQNDGRRDLRTHLPPEARKWIRAAVMTAVTRYCARGRKRLYMDKSLDSVHHLALVRELFPGTRHVLLFRHVMDTIASGIDASPWGFHAYGYAPYVQRSPGNTVAALAGYWLDHVDQALRWEEELPDVCLRVRYEDLVLNPENTLAGILRFLGVEEDLSILQAAFDRNPPRGPGDYKVEHTSAVHGASVGRGKRVPVTMLPPALLTALNEKLGALGYEALDRSWNAAERPIDRGDDDLWGRRLSDLMSSILIANPGPGLGPFAVIADDHRMLRWVVDPRAGTVAPGDGDVESVMTGAAEDLVLMLNGHENLGLLLRSGRVRYLIADDVGSAGRDLLNELIAVVEFLRSAVARPEIVA